MNVHRRSILLAALASAAAPGLAGAQGAYPERPITLVVPYAAGGPTDAAARLLATGLSQVLGQTMVVDNKPGASTIVGTEVVKRSKPDGYTLLFSASSTFGTNPHLYRKLPYKLEDFAAISGVSKVPYVFAVATSNPATDAKSFVEWAKTRPQGVTYGTVGAGGTIHVAGIALERAFGIKMTDVPYKGLSAATPDMIGGMIDSVIETTAAQNLYAAGKIKVLGVMDQQRWPGMPDVPTFTEQGYPNTDAGTVYTLLAPAGVPAAILQKLSDATAKVLSSDDLKTKFRESGQTPFPMSPQQTLEHIRTESERLGAVIKTLGIQLD